MTDAIKLDLKPLRKFEQLAPEVREQFAVLVYNNQVLMEAWSEQQRQIQALALKVQNLMINGGRY